MRTAGFPSPALEYGSSYLSLDEHLVQRPSSTFYVRVGQDILPRFKQGDLLIVDKSLTPQLGQWVVVPAGEEFTVREVTSRSSEMEIWGVIVYVIHKL